MRKITNFNNGLEFMITDILYQNTVADIPNIVEHALWIFFVRTNIIKPLLVAAYCRF